MTHDVSELNGAARAVEGMAVEAVAQVILTTLGVASHNDCWGVDPVGGAFAHAYLGPAEEALGAVQQVAYQIGDVSEKLAATAAAYARTEQENTGAARGVHP